MPESPVRETNSEPETAEAALAPAAPVEKAAEEAGGGRNPSGGGSRQTLKR